MPGDAQSGERPRGDIEAENAALRREVASLKEQLAKALARIDELERAGKRQAAPFSKGPPKADPKRPGRKRGEQYGNWYCRARPTKVDETYDVPLPARCPECGCTDVDPLAVEEQFQTELPRVEPIVRRFRLHTGVCTRCGTPVQPRHPLQTSDALGAAASQLGPNALALGVDLNKAYGLSWGKVAAFIERAFRLKAAPSSYCRAAERLADRAEPTYEVMIRSVAEAPAVHADETGWKVGGHRWWLWAFVTKAVTVYRIEQSRGGDVAEEILGVDFAGLLGRDGWAAYDRLTEATHQSCLAHHFARAGEILKIACRGAARFPHAVIRVLKAALDLRDRRDEISEHGFAVTRGRIEHAMDRLLAWEPTWEPNAAFRNHLDSERPHLFTFLYHPEVEATNWPAEQAIRPAVITRKMSGGNRTARGAHAQEVLTSIVRTAVQQGRDCIDLFARAFCSPYPVDLGLAHGPSG